MNELKGTIKEIRSQGTLSLASVQVGGFNLKAIIIDTPESAGYLEEGKAVSILFKETELILTTGTGEGISIQNRLPGKIVHIEKGKLLSRVVMEVEGSQITAVLTTHSLDEMNLEINQDITGLVKTNEIMISE